MTRVPVDPYLRFDPNDYSLDPRLAGRRVEVRVSQTQVTAVLLDSGELACRHARIVRPPSHDHHDRARPHRCASAADSLADTIEKRPLARYDA